MPKANRRRGVGGGARRARGVGGLPVVPPRPHRPAPAGPDRGDPRVLELRQGRGRVLGADRPRRRARRAGTVGGGS